MRIVHRTTPDGSADVSACPCLDGRGATTVSTIGAVPTRRGFRSQQRTSGDVPPVGSALRTSRNVAPALGASNRLIVASPCTTAATPATRGMARAAVGRMGGLLGSGYGGGGVSPRSEIRCTWGERVLRAIPARRSERRHVTGPGILHQSKNAAPDPADEELDHAAVELLYGLVVAPDLLLETRQSVDRDPRNRCTQNSPSPPHVLHYYQARWCRDGRLAHADKLDRAAADSAAHIYHPLPNACVHARQIRRLPPSLGLSYSS